MGGEPASRSVEDCSCKVGESLVAWGRGDLADELPDRRSRGASLRELEAVVNRAILRRALDGAHATVVGDVEHVYRGLTGEVTAGRRTEVRQQLESAGVDVDRVTSDFVSYGTIRRHLRECLGADTGRGARLTREDARGTIEWARSRSEGVIGRTIERLAETDVVVAGDLETAHVVHVSCSACGVSYPVGEFLSRDGCDCATDR